MTTNYSITKRTTIISLSPDEKKKLDHVAEDIYGEADTIPYGLTVSMLVSEYRDNS